MAKDRDNQHREKTAKRLSRRGFNRALDECLQSHLTPAMQRFGLAEGRILTHWADIVGPELARVTLPERLRFAKGQRTDGTLTIRVATGWAPVLQHQTPQLLDQLAAYFGYRAVSRISIRQDHRLLAHQESDLSLQPTGTLDSASKSTISEMVSDCADEGLRDSLTALGRSIRLREVALEKQRQSS